MHLIERIWLEIGNKTNIDIYSCILISNKLRFFNISSEEMADLSTSQKRAEARALEDRIIGFMKENNLTKAQLLETMEKMVDDQDTTSTATEQSNTLSMYAATVAARKVVNEFHKSIEQLEKDLMPGTFSNV